MAHVVSTINLKGGVGKTTTTAALSEIMASEYGRRVLLIDLDPQTNLTVLMLGESRWRRLNAAGHTLATLFRDAVEPDPTGPRFDLAATLQRDASPVRAVHGIDLLPSSLDLIDLQDRLLTVAGPAGAAGLARAGSAVSRTAPVDLLAREVSKIEDDYDIIFVDCPPNLSTLTLNGVRISDGYIIPTIPDYMSSYGVTQVRSKIEAFAATVGRPIPPLGLIVSRYRVGATLHEFTVSRLRREAAASGLHVFDTMIPDSVEIAKAAEYSEWGTVRQRYGYDGQFEALARLTREVLAAVGSPVT